MSQAVQLRIKKLVQQRRDAEIETKNGQELISQLQKRLERLERGTQNQVQSMQQKEFDQRYNLTKQAIEKAIEEATPEQMLELKKAEQEFEVKMKELEVDVFRLETEDIQDARSRFGGDWTSKILGFITIGGFMGYIFLVTLQPPEQNSEALINLVLGYLGGLASAIISFYFGASNTSDKGE